jgi:hypothetical protein
MVWKRSFERRFTTLDAGINVSTVAVHVDFRKVGFRKGTTEVYAK